ncbi:hypothetical protein PR048_025698 [Dryococelus australis]|uniref:Uncharacterized protein n=1 Tax=Dryococelus australis TaxID=614101 RepID=A0ABQ9GJB0_9NEOP|nr:hypothetical protein PR048_025698 [Dryococelus australis]
MTVKLRLAAVNYPEFLDLLSGSREFAHFSRPKQEQAVGDVVQSGVPAVFYWRTRRVASDQQLKTSLPATVLSPHRDVRHGGPIHALADDDYHGRMIPVLSNHKSQVILSSTPYAIWPSDAAVGNYPDLAITYTNQFSVHIKALASFHDLRLAGGGRRSGVRTHAIVQGDALSTRGTHKTPRRVKVDVDGWVRDPSPPRHHLSHAHSPQLSDTLGDLMVAATLRREGLETWFPSTTCILLLRRRPAPPEGVNTAAAPRVTCLGLVRDSHLYPCAAHSVHRKGANLGGFHLGPASAKADHGETMFPQCEKAAVSLDSRNNEVKYGFFYFLLVRKHQPNFARSRLYRVIETGNFCVLNNVHVVLSCAMYFQASAFCSLAALPQSCGQFQLRPGSTGIGACFLAGPLLAQEFTRSLQMAPVVRGNETGYFSARLLLGKKKNIPFAAGERLYASHSGRGGRRGISCQVTMKKDRLGREKGVIILRQDTIQRLWGRLAFFDWLKHVLVSVNCLRTNHEGTVSELRNPEWLGHMRKRHQQPMEVWQQPRCTYSIEIYCVQRFIREKSVALHARLPPRRTGFDPRLGHRIGWCHWSAGFLKDLPFLPPLHSGAASYSLHSPLSALKTSLLRARTLILIRIHKSGSHQRLGRPVSRRNVRDSAQTRHKPRAISASSLRPLSGRHIFARVDVVCPLTRRLISCGASWVTPSWSLRVVTRATIVFLSQIFDYCVRFRAAAASLKYYAISELPTEFTSAVWKHGQTKPEAQFTREHPAGRVRTSTAEAPRGHRPHVWCAPGLSVLMASARLLIAIKERRKRTFPSRRSGLHFTPPSWHAPVSTGGRGRRRDTRRPDDFLKGSVKGNLAALRLVAPAKAEETMRPVRLTTYARDIYACLLSPAGTALVKHAGAVARSYEHKSGNSFAPQDTVLKEQRLVETDLCIKLGIRQHFLTFPCLMTFQGAQLSGDRNKESATNTQLNIFHHNCVVNSFDKFERPGRSSLVPERRLLRTREPEMASSFDENEATPRMNKRLSNVKQGFQKRSVYREQRVVWLQACQRLNNAWRIGTSGLFLSPLEGGKHTCKQAASRKIASPAPAACLPDPRTRAAFRNFTLRVNFSLRVKIRLYNTVIKPEASYGSECLTMNKKGELRELEEKFRDHSKTDNTWTKRKNEDLYRNTEKITDTILTKKIFIYIAKLKWTAGWMVEAKKGVEKVGITEELFNNRENIRQATDRQCKISGGPTEAKTQESGKFIKQFHFTRSYTLCVVPHDTTKNSNNFQYKTSGRTTELSSLPTCWNVSPSRPATHRRGDGSAVASAEKRSSPATIVMVAATIVLRPDYCDHMRPAKGGGGQPLPVQQRHIAPSSAAGPVAIVRLPLPGYSSAHANKAQPSIENYIKEVAHRIRVAMIKRFCKLFLLPSQIVFVGYCVASVPTQSFRITDPFGIHLTTQAVLDIVFMNEQILFD